jgi:transketolase N-terminal domain/subunit
MKEPRIMQMDWKALGYERMYLDGRLRWIPKQVHKASQDEQPTA